MLDKIEYIYFNILLIYINTYIITFIVATEKTFTAKRCQYASL